MYKWNNECKLDTLKVYGENDVLIFETKNEKAKVYIVNNDIEKITITVDGKEQEITKNDRKHIVVGDGNTQRDVYHYLMPNGPTPTLRLGITKHRGEGTWSSLPHNFELNTEPGFEEVFFYITEGATQRGFQVGRGVWFDNSSVDGVWPISDRTFNTVPMGYHPVVAEPGVKMSYVWAYLAKMKRWEKI
ncbi:MAG: 5-deoxy-glucuronate isomerase [Candidatus Gracilibacteria bacterium]